MYLRSLKLVGFKSFADRTRIEFEPGVTVVVGPNGSGKSNLVEAIAWVMGTQAPSTVRTQRMDDVIFAGTSTRPAVGRSEVSITFDNRSRQLPLDLDEVAITRRLYRDGTSGYEINGADCRLLDVQDLLSDSGVGRHQHVIVGQGQLDGVLNASAEDHRAIIEEAAGILKHRLRKDRAERRLERTDGDVLRLHDLIRELRRQMRPLKRQAEAAERHERALMEARTLRLFLGGERLRSVISRLASLEEEHRRIVDELEGRSDEAARIDASLERLDERAAEAGQALDRHAGAAARLDITSERIRRIAQVAQERRRNLESRLRGAGERRRDLEKEARQLEIELARSSEQERRAGREAERCEGELRTIDDEERSLAEQGALPPEGAAALVRGELRALETAQERDSRENEALSRRLEVVRGLEKDESAQVDAIGVEVQVLDSLATQAQAAYERARGESRTAQEAWDLAQGDLEDARLRLAAAEARLEGLERGGSGVADPAGRLWAEEQLDKTVREALDVPSELVAACNAALGNLHDALSAGDRARMDDMAARLKSEGLGGVGLVASGSEVPRVPARSIAGELGLDALIDRLGPDADEHLAGRLLGDVLLVEGWSTAREVVGRYPGIRAVTPEGDLLTSHAIRLADPEGTSLKLVEAARATHLEAEVVEARARSRSTTTHRDFEGTRRTERASLECLEALEAGTAGATEALDRLERTRQAAAEERSRLEDRIRAVGQESDRRLERMSGLRERLGALEGEEAVRREAWEGLAARRAEVSGRRDRARGAREEAASVLATVGERRRLLQRRLSEVHGDLQALVVRPVDPARVARLAEIGRLAVEAKEVVGDHLAELRDRRRELGQEARDAEERLKTARARLDELHREIGERRSHIGRLEIEIVELRVRAESEEEALHRELDASREEALSISPPALPEGVLPEDRLESLESELRRMGAVNPLAAAEYLEVSQRFEFVQAQLDDLERSRDELGKVIRELDAQMVELFRSAYDEVARHFEESFALLFPGGRGRLRMTDAARPLTTGVEIEAQPLGKRINRLSLLSGGERSLAALAFLFAVFKARPSPFYVLDEVDAALDDANLRRFLRLVDQLRGAAQLIIVTHQQQTMEAADILYGVTMEPGGSSQVVARRMTELAVPA